MNGDAAKPGGKTSLGDRWLGGVHRSSAIIFLLIWILTTIPAALCLLPSAGSGGSGWAGIGVGAAIAVVLGLAVLSTLTILPLAGFSEYLARRVWLGDARAKTYSFVLAWLAIAVSLFPGSLILAGRATVLFVIAPGAYALALLIPLKRKWSIALAMLALTIGCTIAVARNSAERRPTSSSPPSSFAGVERSTSSSLQPRISPAWKPPTPPPRGVLQGLYRGFALSPNGRYAANLGAGWMVWKTATGKLIAEHTEPADADYLLEGAITDDGAWLMLAPRFRAPSSQIAIWRVADGQLHGNAPFQGTWPKDPRFARGAKSEHYRLKRLIDGELQLVDAQPLDHWPKAVSFNGKLVAYHEYESREIRVMTGDGEILRRVTLPDERQYRTTPNIYLPTPDGCVVSGSKTLFIWPSGPDERIEHNLPSRMGAIAFDEKANSLIVASESPPTVHWFDAATGKLQRQWEPRLSGDQGSHATYRCRLSLDGSMMASLNVATRRLHRLDLVNQSEILTQPGLGADSPPASR